MKHLPGPALGGLALALAGAALSVLPAAPATAAAAPTDPSSPAALGAAWILDELEDGLMPSSFGPNEGQTIDIGFSLIAIGGQQAGLDLIATAVSDRIADGNYISGGSFDPGSTYGNALAKSVAFGQAAGRDLATFGGGGLLTRLEGQISTAEGAEGRLEDTSTFGSFTNTFGQAFAVAALARAGSTEATSALAFLDAQQCSGGWLRQSLGATLAATCDEDGGLPSIDATATAAIQLSGVPAAADLVDDAVAWLKSAQRFDGSFPQGNGQNDSNANSTGLAGLALGLNGETAAAADAATWLRLQQADDVAPCTTGLTAERGAIAFDPAALGAARADGIDEAVRPQFRLATAQALGAFAYADDSAPTSEPTSNAGFVRAGSLQNLQITGVAPGRTLCVVRLTDGQTKLLNADAEGNASPIVRAGRADRTQDVKFRIKLGTETLGTVTLRALAPTSFVVQAPARASRRGDVVVAVTGLAAGERGLVRIVRGDEAVGKSRRADADGLLKVRVPLEGLALGRAVIKVQGFFDDRRGSKALRITR